jgi:hypothetical protein
MRRRDGLVWAATAPLLLQGCAMSEVKTFPTLAAARQAIVASASGWKSTGAWNLAQVFNHAAQSVEYSLRGFPEMKPGLFRHTVGTLAFTVFDARGAMSHGLAEPIPGAPVLAAADPLEPAIARLLKSLDEFEAHQGPLAPHFAYGALDKAQFTRAHLMHLANHWQEIVKA